LKKDKIVFLYTELAGYTISCIESLASTGTEIMVFRYPVNNEAPFVFKHSEQFFLLDRKSFSFEEMLLKIESFLPDLIFCSGWIDKDYIKICAYFRKKKIRTILCLDNQWKFSVKQLTAVIVSPFFIKPNFDSAWVPGKIQRKFVSKLGFKPEKIFEGFYCADTQKWNAMFEKNFSDKKKNFPKRFIYIGRYYDFKGVQDLWKAFEEFSKDFSEWELWCLGTGDIEPLSHAKIKHIGFVQPHEIEKYIAQTGVFILPSRFEPWGVVVHEMAAAGFPMILSNAVGAAEAFLAEGENGFIFEKENVKQLAKLMARFAQYSNEQLIGMSQKSHEMGKKITLQSWVNTVNQIKN
jgi:glycosyltransferase involved in cell wall biosynthesis